MTDRARSLASELIGVLDRLDQACVERADEAERLLAVAADERAGLIAEASSHAQHCLSEVDLAQTAAGSLRSRVTLAINRAVRAIDQSKMRCMHPARRLAGLAVVVADEQTIDTDL